MVWTHTMPHMDLTTLQSVGKLPAVPGPFPGPTQVVGPCGAWRAAHARWLWPARHARCAGGSWCRAHLAVLRYALLADPASLKNALGVLMEVIQRLVHRVAAPAVPGRPPALAALAPLRHARLPPLRLAHAADCPSQHGSVLHAMRGRRMLAGRLGGPHGPTYSQGCQQCTGQALARHARCAPAVRGWGSRPAAAAPPGAQPAARRHAVSAGAVRA